MSEERGNKTGITRSCKSQIEYLSFLCFNIFFSEIQKFGLNVIVRLFFTVHKLFDILLLGLYSNVNIIRILTWIWFSTDHYTRPFLDQDPNLLTRFYI